MQNLISTLRNLVQEAAIASSPQKRVRGIVERVKATMGVAVCSLYLVDERDVLTLVATEGLNPASVGKVKLHLGEGLVGRIAQTQHPLNLESASQDPHFRYFPETGEERFEAFLGTPVIHAGRLVGVLVIEQQERRKFSEEEESFLATVAAHLGAANPIEFQLALGSQEPGGRAHPTRRLKGLSGAPGVGIGRVVLLLSDGEDLMSVPDRESRGEEIERQQFRDAVAATLEDLAEGQRKVADHVPGELADVFGAYQMILKGANLSAEVERGIAAGQTAASALRTVVAGYAARFEAVEDEYLRSRGEDIHNLGSQIFAHLQDSCPIEIAEGEKVVLFGRLVSIADIAAHPIENLAGIVSMEGSALSHTAVLAKALGLPAVMGVGYVADLPEEEPVIVDGHQGQVLLAPSPAVLEEFSRLIEREQSLLQDLAKLKDLPAETPDGFRVHLYANTGLLADMTPGLRHGAEGIGLYRSEIPFLVRESFPSEDDQYEVYRTVLEFYAGKPVCMRTLDVGGDKPLPYYLVEENNPALGWRGVRFTLDNSAIFLTQIRAMLRASSGIDNLQIMLPMVSSVSEVDAFAVLLESARQQLREEGIVTGHPKVGIMAEVPAVIPILPFLKGKIDFVSIGSNDLSQYLLAIDRDNPRVAERFDHLHPAILHAIEEIVSHTRVLGIPLSVCGEMASDPHAVVLLLGMGIESLSMSAFSIPRIKWLLRSVPREAAEHQLGLAKRHAEPARIRAQIREFISEQGLGSLLEPPVAESL